MSVFVLKSLKRAILLWVPQGCKAVLSGAPAICFLPSWNKSWENSLPRLGCDANFSPLSSSLALRRGHPTREKGSKQDGSQNKYRLRSVFIMTNWSFFPVLNECRWIGFIACLSRTCKPTWNQYCSNMSCLLFWLWGWERQPSVPKHCPCRSGIRLRGQCCIFQAFIIWPVGNRLLGYISSKVSHLKEITQWTAWLSKRGHL